MSQYERSDLHREADHMAREARAETEATANEVKSRAQNLGEEAKGAVSDIAAEARGTKDTIVSEVTGAISSAKQGLVDKAEEQKSAVADRIGGVADSMHASADDLRGREAWLADLMDRGAQEIGGFADALKNRDLGSLVSSVEGFARRQPALFLGITVALGFGLARVARASAERRTQPSYPAGGAPFPDTYTPNRTGSDYGTYTSGSGAVGSPAGGVNSTGSYGTGSAGYGLSEQPSTVELDRGERVGDADRRKGGGVGTDPVSGSAY